MFMSCGLLLTLASNRTTMKNLLPLGLLVAMLASCNTQELEQRIEQLEHEKTRLEMESAHKDSVLVAFDESFATISRNLAMIRESEETIRLESKNIELSTDQRAAIEAEIQDINALLQANKEQIAQLNKTVSNYKGEVGRYKNIIDGLERQIVEKDKQIEDLKQNLIAANFTIDILNRMNEELAEEIRKTQTNLDQLTTQSNEVYYVIGTFKELKELDIAERAGLIAGKKMRQDFNRDDFIAIDKREVTEINLSSKKAELLSAHPSEAYKFEGETDEDHKLVITNPELFWSTTSYLIVQIK